MTEDRPIDQRTPTGPTSPTPGPAESPPGVSLVGRLLLTGGLALVCGFLGAYILQRFENQDARRSEQAARASIHRAAADSAPPAVSNEDRVREIEALQSKIGALSQKLDRLQTQFDQTTRTSPPSSLSALRIKVAELDKTVGETAPLPERVSKLDERLNELAEGVDLLRGDLKDLQTRAERGRATDLKTSGSGDDSARRVAPASHDAASSTRRREAAKPVADSRRDQNAGSFEQGAKLFRQGKYQEALPIFNKLEVTDPDDPRVWYFAALCRGFQTNEWEGETQKLVEKGIDLESSGAVPKSRIDESFRNLTPATGKDWLHAYRERVRRD